MLICTKCKIEKETTEFHKHTTSKTGLQSQCKDCRNVYRNSFYSQNKHISKTYYENKKNSIKEERKQYFQDNKEYFRKYKANRRKLDIQYRLSDYLRSRLNKALKGNYKTGSAVRDLGCSIEDFKLYLESKFEQGMNWNNYGMWHIDHIKPLVSFELSERKELLKAVHYTNLQPLWAIDNLKKGGR